MKNMIIVRAYFDNEAKVWVAGSDDISGLALESESLETLMARIPAALTDLIELNDEEFARDLPDIPYQIMAEQIGRIAKSA